MVKVTYEPISAKDALKQIRNICSILVDLAYSAVLFEDRSLAREVDELRDLVIKLNYLLTMSLQVAVRDGKDAQATLPLVVLGEASKNIANYTADLAHVLLKGFNVHHALKELSQKVARDLMRGEIAEDSVLKGYTVHDVAAKMNFSVVIFAIRREGRWNIPPDAEVELAAGDVVLARGSTQSISLLKLLVGGSAEEIAPPEEEEFMEQRETFEDTILDNLIAIKDTSEVVIELAYGAVLYNNSELAQLVSSMEKRIDAIRNKSEIAILRAAKDTTEDLSALQGLFRVIESMEDISDSANTIAQTVLAGLPAHPIIELVIEESTENIFQKTVEEASLIVGKTVPAGNYLDEFGIRIIGIKRAGGNFFKPRRRTKIRAGDVIIFTGRQEACQAFQKREKEAVEEKEAEIEATKKAAEEALDEVVEKVADEIVSEASKEVAKKAVEGVVDQAVEKAKDKVTKKATEEAATEAVKKVEEEELTEDLIEQVAAAIAKEILEEVKREKPEIEEEEENIKEAAQQAAKKTAKDAIEKVQEVTRKAAETAVEEKSNFILQKAKKEVAKKAEKEVESAVIDAAKPEAQKAGKRAATEAIKETAPTDEPETLLKEAATEAAKEVAGTGVEKAAERTGKKVATKTAESTAIEIVEKETKKIAGEAAEEAAKKAAKEVLNKDVKEEAEKATKKAVKEAAKKLEK
ncbi:MAG: hypothetical protein GF308_04315 [Candidatus Heimdallarchaeota archaeon]|nr:hypothetical protein [Candidatus Heimdallarchaeota archaeon]